VSTRTLGLILALTLLVSLVAGLEVHGQVGRTAPVAQGLWPAYSLPLAAMEPANQKAGMRMATEEGQPFERLTARFDGLTAPDEVEGFPSHDGPAIHGGEKPHQP